MWTHQPGSQRGNATQYFSTFLLRCLPYFFIPRRIQPSISLVYREAEFCVPTINGIISNSLFGVYAKKLDRRFVEVVQ